MDVELLKFQMVKYLTSQILHDRSFTDAEKQKVADVISTHEKYVDRYFKRDLTWVGQLGEVMYAAFGLIEAVVYKNQHYTCLVQSCRTNRGEADILATLSISDQVAIVDELLEARDQDGEL